MKIKEEFIDGEGDTFHIKTTYDNDPYLHRAKTLNEVEQSPMSESYRVASLPAHLLTQWAKEAGVKWGSPEHKEVVKKKILSGEVNKLRGWMGTY